MYAKARPTRTMIATGKHVRPPAAAGTFYPAEPSELRHLIARYLRDAEPSGPYPKALIVPHAGFVYSGPVAANGYVLLKPIHSQIERVILLGPAHRTAFYGLAVPDCEEFATPLGDVPLDARSLEITLRLPQVHRLDEAHRHEHSLEVQLPFLQFILARFSIVPILVGRVSAAEVAEVLEHLWRDDNTLIVASSDLSHFHDYRAARSIDSETAHLIERCQWQQLSRERACGFGGIQGLLKVAKTMNLQVHTVDLRNSGDTAGSRDEVVGYGSFVIY